MITGRERQARYFTIVAMLTQALGLDTDAAVERVMDLMRLPPADEIRAYQEWIRELLAALGATGPDGERVGGMDNLMPGINPGLNWKINSAYDPCPDCDETGEDGCGNECTTCSGSGWVVWEPSYGDSYAPGDWEGEG